MNKVIHIGRSETNDIVISDTTVSRNHGILTIEGGNYFYEDLNSANGSFINGNRIVGKIQLKKTDILKLGKSLLPWQNYITEDIPKNEKIESIPNSEPVVNNYSNYSQPINNNKSKIKQYWPVLIAVVLIAVIIIVMLGKSNKKEVSNNEDNTEINDSTELQNNEANENVEHAQLISDSDNDGVNDENDKCPNEKGPRSNYGCPNPDSDNDGVPDKEDQCKNSYGPKWNDGCPEQNYEEEYRTECPYCNALSYESSTNRWWNCGTCGERFYNCYRSSVGDHDGIKSEWFYDGDCDCYNCADE
jgi:hypothetical protein